MIILAWIAVIAPALIFVSALLYFFVRVVDRTDAILIGIGLIIIGMVVLFGWGVSYIGNYHHQTATVQPEEGK